jgi:hypothetical protein
MIALLIFYFLNHRVLADELKYNLLANDTNISFEKNDHEKLSNQTLNYYSNRTNDRAYNLMKSRIGFIRPPYSKINHIVKTNKEVIFNTIYETDSFGFRINPNEELALNKKFHLLVFGDSNTFGEGVKINETFTDVINQKSSKYHAYNLGISGGSPSNSLAFLKFYQLKNKVSEEEGTLFYNYYTDYLIERVIGSKNYICWDHGLGPRFVLKDHKLVYKGPFKDNFPLFQIYSFICEHHYLNKLIKNLPRVKKSDFELLASIFMEMKAEYLKQFPKGNFIVVLNDFYQLSRTELSQELESVLNEKKISYIRRPGILNLKENVFKHNYHLNSKGHLEEANFFLKSL